MIAQAQSGTGKTATFAISILQQIELDLKATQALVLAPTRELAQQVRVVSVPSLKADLGIMGMIQGPEKCSLITTLGGREMGALTLSRPAGLIRSYFLPKCSHHFLHPFPESNGKALG